MNPTLTSLPTLPPRKADSEHDPLEYLSASRLKCFQTCRLQFYFRYIERIPTPISPALLVGQVVHRVLQAWNLARWRGEDSSVEAMQPFFEAHWVEGCDKEDMIWDSPDQEVREKSRAWSILEHYLRHTPVPLDERPEAVEVVVERDLDAHGLPPLKGVIDLVREGGRIVDFKTTARTPDPDQARHQNEVQLGCYALLYRETTGQMESGFELHHLVKTKVPKLVVTPLEPLDRDRVTRLLRVMESYVCGVLAEDFVPSPGLHCGYCDYFEQCRAWKGGAA